MVVFIWGCPVGSAVKIYLPLQETVFIHESRRSSGEGMAIHFSILTWEIAWTERYVWLFATPWIAASQASLSFTISWSLPSSCPLNWGCYPNISSSAALFSSCPQSFPASGSFPMNWLFASGGQSIGVSASASVLPMNIQEWFPLGLTSLISLQSKGLSRVFSNTTVQKHQFFGAQPSLWSNCHIHT